MWVSTLIPRVGADTYDGVRVGVFFTEEDAYRDIGTWLLEGYVDEADEEAADKEETTDDEDSTDDLGGIAAAVDSVLSAKKLDIKALQSLLSDSDLITHWNVQSQTVYK